MMNEEKQRINFGKYLEPVCVHHLMTFYTWPGQRPAIMCDIDGKKFATSFDTHTQHI